MKQIIIIGGGPAGMMAAISSKIHYPDTNVTILERNNCLGKKLRLTGGGRCNVTANVDNKMVIENVPKNGRFLYSALSEFGPKQIIDFFNTNGCPLKEEDHFRMFPKSNNSLDIINTFIKVLTKLNVDIVYEAFVKDIEFENKKIILENKELKYDAVIIATGGTTYTHTGSDGNGYKLSKKLGHKISRILPAEVPLVSNDPIVQDKTLMGLSFKDVSLKVMYKNKVIRSITHDLIITHFGLSGPASLRASYDCINLFEQQEKLVEVRVDFIPSINFEPKKTTKEEVVEILKNNNIPKRLINYLKTNSTTLEDFINKIKNFPFNISSTRGMKVAFVTNGGINPKEINPKTMKSKLNDTVSFCGEIIDYNAYTGGFNITCALSTGYVAGKHVLDN